MSDTLPPNLTKAVAGQYELNVKNIYQEAWQKVSGIKKTFWAGFSFILLIIFLWVGIVYGVKSLLGFYGITFSELAANIIYDGYEIPFNILYATFSFLILNYIAGDSVNFKMLFAFKGMIVRLLNMGLIIYLLCIAQELAGAFFDYQGLIYWLLVIFFTYLFAILMFAMLLVLERELNIFTAIYVALKAFNRRLIKNVWLLILAAAVIVLGGAITLGIGLIWIVPLVTNAYVIQYRQIFGIEQVA